MFIDKAKIFVKAGTGGNGCISFRREKFVPLGGPNGGNGGRAGDVIARATKHLRTLVDLHYHPHYKAQNGGHGEGSNRAGKSAPHLIVKVPVGTVIYRDDTKEVIADLIEDGQEVILAKGGRGGRGNASFKSAVHRAPRISEKGEPGEEVVLDLELKLLADIGIIGYPNAGKSTLLARITRAHPKIADYPFTTLNPNLGVARISAEESFVLADIPGLIDGAHAGIGLGDEFLRHIERTRLLIHLVDITGFEGKSAFENYKAINRELKLYNPALAKKKQIIVANKIDLPEAKTKLPEFKKSLTGKRIYAISALTGVGIKEFIYAIADNLEKTRLEPFYPEQATYKQYKLETGFEIKRVSDHFIVTGKEVERLIAMTNLGEEEAVARMQRILNKMGVEKALREKGVRAGDLIKIGNFEFEFTE